MSKREKYNDTMARLNRIDHKGYGTPLDDKSAVILLTDEINYYRNKIKRYEEEIELLISDNAALKNSVVKLVIQIYGA